ncbi:hypothetical protein HGRIS_007423 [Hohenbuehelia grisea]|uniref:Small-subunit processome Utp12 domain-containing protein n=1 Tax=Hohenbuehelia grisea TaxID=104357 RepID=A0ABR3J536_9AGAR
MASLDKSKKPRTKPPKGRPVSTSAISQPAVEHAAHLTSLSSFSPKSDYFAFLSLAVDKHRLRVYDTATGQAVAEHTLETARATALEWAYYDAKGGEVEDVSPSPNKKRRKKRYGQTAKDGGQPQKGTLVVIVGESDGSISLFAPEHGRVVKTLSHATSTASILSVAVSQQKGALAVWSSSADGAIRLWLPSNNGLAGTWKSDDRIPYTSLATMQLPSEESEEWTTVLAAHHSMRLLSMAPDSDIDSQKPKQLATFTGHASSIKQLRWDNSQQPPNRFLTVAESDRLVYIWEVPKDGEATTEGNIIASIPLDSDAQAISLSASTPTDAKRQTLLTLASSGRISIFPVPSELTPPANTKGAQHKVSTLLPRSNISTASKRSSAAVRTAAAAFVPEVEGSIKVARLVGGVRPVFNIVKYLDASGDFIQDLTLDEVQSSLVTEAGSSVLKANRYAEGAAAVGSGADLGQDQDMDDLILRSVEGELDADLAELSLGQRLAVMSGPAAGDDGSDSDASDAPRQGGKKSRARQAVERSADLAPATSLTRTLIQALHSSDARLLETCLAHSNRTLINNTVRRLPPQLAVPLVTACVERLGRGGRGSTMRGGGGGASSQRGTALITWVKAVLTMHSGHLMTMPDLIARLSGLHATLTTRLALQESLLSLSGRLDMVLSQIEMRSSAAPAPLTAPKGKAPAPSKTAARQYIEGESEDEDEDEQMDVEVEVGDDDDDASIEDVELGGDSDESEEEEEEEDDDEEDDDDDEPTMNGFIDDEAEEDDEEEDESESE